MDPVTNPFRPGAGRRPPLLAGRSATLAAFDAVRRRAEQFGEGDRSWVLHGLRGVGKTVLLNELMAQAGQREWITAKVEAGSSEDFPTALSRSLVSAIRTATGRHPERRLHRLLQVFKAFTLNVDPTGAVGFGIEVAPLRGVADSGSIADDLAALFEVLGETARELGIGVLLLLDELQQAAPSELRALNAAVHQLGQAEFPLPVVVVGAGLPSLPSLLAAATSYAERLYEYRAIGLLDADAAEQALVVPTANHGVSWRPDALATALAAAGGYPYFLQAIGKHVWDNTAAPRITEDDVAVGLAAARREVDDGLYRTRWERATPAQRELLRALAAAEEPAAMRAIAASVGKRLSDLSVARDEVIKKGLAFAPERGLLAFTVPGMAEFIGRQA